MTLICQHFMVMSAIGGIVLCMGVTCAMCILVHRNFSCRRVQLAPFPGGVLEVLAVKLQLESGSPISIINLYNPKAGVSHQEFSPYIDQFTDPFILACDFNAHSSLLSSGCTRSDTTDRSLELLFVFNLLCYHQPG